MVGWARLGEDGRLAASFKGLPPPSIEGGAMCESKAKAWLCDRLAIAASMPASEYDCEGVSAGPRSWISGEISAMDRFLASGQGGSPVDMV